MEFILATFNRDKLRELTALLGLPGVALRALCDLPGAVAPEETGATLCENALLKARAALALTGRPAIADDTGLEVDALGGRPGIHAARYAGPGASYADNRARHVAERAQRDPGQPQQRREFPQLVTVEGGEDEVHGVPRGVERRLRRRARA